MPVILGNASRPSFDAAAAMLHNKQIEYQKAIALAQIKAANARAAMGALEGLGKQLLGQANQNAQQKAQIDAQRQAQERQQQQRAAEQKQQQELAGLSMLDKRLFEMQQDWANNNAKAAAAGMKLSDADQKQSDKLDQQIRNVDANNTLGPAQKMQVKIQLMQDKQRLVPNEKIVTAQQQFDAQQVVDKNGNTLVGDGKGNFKPLPVDTMAQKVAEQQRKSSDSAAKMLMDKDFADRMGWDEIGNIAERLYGINPTRGIPAPANWKGKPGGALTDSQKMTLYAKFREQVENNIKDLSKVDPSAIHDEAMKRFNQAINSISTGSPQTINQMLESTGVTSSQLAAANAFINKYGRHPTGVNAEVDQFMSQARGIVAKVQSASLAKSSTQPKAASLQPTINGIPITPFQRHATMSPRIETPEQFSANPISKDLIEFHQGDVDAAFKDYKNARDAVINSLPTVHDATQAQDLAKLQPSDLHLSERGDIRPVYITASQSTPSGGGSSGGQPAGPQPSQQARPQQGGFRTTPPQIGGQNAAQQQPNAPQAAAPPAAQIRAPKKSRPNTGGVPPMTRLFLEKGSQAEKDFHENIELTLSPEQRSQILVETIDQSKSTSATNRKDAADKYGITMYPAMVRFENDGSGTLVRAAQETGAASMSNITEFIQSGTTAGPPEGKLQLTYVFVEKGGASERHWNNDIQPHLSTFEKSQIEVFTVNPKQPSDKEHIESVTVAARSRITLDQFPIVARGDWDGTRWVSSPDKIVKGHDALKSVKEFKQFIRPSSEIRESEALKQDASASATARKNFDANLEKSGNPLSGMADPNRSTEGMDASQRRSQENYKKTYEDWKKSHPGIDGEPTTPEQARQEIETKQQNVDDQRFEEWKKEHSDEYQGFHELFDTNKSRSGDPLKGYGPESPHPSTNLPDPYRSTEGMTNQEMKDEAANYRRTFEDWKKIDAANTAANIKSNNAAQKALQKSREAEKPKPTAPTDWTEADQKRADAYRRQAEAYDASVKKELTKEMEKRLKSGSRETGISGDMQRAAEARVKAQGVAKPMSENEPTIKALLQREQEYRRREQQRQTDQFNKMQQDKNRTEAEGFMHPRGLAVAPGTGVQPMRTAQLQRPLSLSGRDQTRYDPMVAVKAALDIQAGKQTSTAASLSAQTAALHQQQQASLRSGFDTFFGNSVAQNQQSVQHVPRYSIPPVNNATTATQDMAWFGNPPGGGYGNVIAPNYTGVPLMQFESSQSPGYMDPLSFGSEGALGGYGGYGIDLPPEPSYESYFPPYIGDPNYLNVNGGYYPAGDYNYLINTLSIG
jgi:hypothetical protein